MLRKTNLKMQKFNSETSRSRIWESQSITKPGNFQMIMQIIQNDYNVKETRVGSAENKTIKI